MARNKKIDADKILNELFKRSFAESTPYGDWDKLLEEAPINALGQKAVPFQDYECDHKKMEEIFDSVMAEYKVPKNMIKAFSFHFWLGPSPKSKNFNPYERKEVSGV